MSKHHEQIVAAAQGKIPEQILAAAFAKPRGATTAAAAGGLGSAIGRKWADKQDQGAAGAGIELGNPGAVAVTPTSLVTMAVGVSMMGKITDVKQVLSRVPLADVDSVTVKRMGAAGVMEIAAGGGTFKLEGKVPDMKAVADAFGNAKATAR